MAYSRSYCGRCNKHFPYPHAKEQHIKDSPRHHVCTRCSDEPDFSSEDDLDEHLIEDHHACVPCSRFFNNDYDLMQHDVAVHNLCRTCRRYFDSRSNLINHHKVHAPKNVECLGCTRMFNSHSAMMLHLEAGTCESGADLESITSLVAGYYDMYGSWDHDDDDNFRCRSCRVDFERLSALLQHVESEACDEDVSNFDSLFDYLEDNIDC